MLFESAYQVYYRWNPSERFILLGELPANQTSEPITDLIPGTAYEFQVLGINSVGTSAGSSIAYATTLPDTETVSARVTVLNQSSPDSPIASNGAGNSAFNSLAAAAYLDFNNNRVVNDAAGGATPFPVTVMPAPPTETTPPWIVREGNAFENVGGVQANLIIYAEIPPTGGARPQNREQFIAFHLRVNEANRTFTPVSMYAGDRTNLHGRILRHISIDPIQDGTYAAPTATASGRVQGRVQAVLSFGEVGGNPITTTLHTSHVEFEFDVPVLRQ